MTTALNGPFSQPSRVALIDAYFGERKVAPADAWKDVYRLLLWADPTTGLAHCYESDKAQPGRPWYARTLAFHAWVAAQLGTGVDELPGEIDWMFRSVIQRVAAEEAAKRQILAERGRGQRKPYEAQGMPEPGDDPELRELLEPLLPKGRGKRPGPETVREVLRTIRAYIASENKRKNLLGRGFEDVLKGILDRLDGPRPVQTGAQTALQEIPGFRAPRPGDKEEKVDLWAKTKKGSRALVSAKWSVRADREKQFFGDYRTYVTFNELREPFGFYWITNEFDPARLRANATYIEGNRPLFDAVVHVCPEALHVVHDLSRPDLPKTLAELREQLGSGRIISLASWLELVSRS
jgi:hypothetical protein